MPKALSSCLTALRRRPLPLLARLAGVVTLAGVAILAPAGAALAQSAPMPKPDQTAGADTPMTDAERYCRNTGSAANDARLAWQTWNLVALEEKVQVRIRELEQKRAEYQAWVERREKVLSEVEGHVVSIFQRMRPEAAAAQLATLDEDTAVAVLVKLNARAASQILDEMEPARAAQLTNSMAGLTKSEAQGSL
ncbi:MotE family protein [Pannonibacter tanglangensis]|uniref:MotE family protein n=1 Tax=Pannonibacter tanglangensis TaxID=2750084 RepID=UPI0015D1EFDA|nr:MotE family protein [Pannonibacter sp. XCT-53]